MVIGNRIASTIHNVYYRYGVSSILLLKDSATSLFVTFPFKAFNPFYELFNRMIGNLANGGIYNHWLAIFLKSKGFNPRIDEIGPQVLTMEHLEIGFLICIGASVTSIIAFGLEKIFKCCEIFTVGIKSKLRDKIIQMLKPKQAKFKMARIEKNKKRHGQKSVVSLKQKLFDFKDEIN